MNYNILVIGAVKTTQITLDKLYEHGFNIVGVLGHEPKNRENVSGWSNLKEQASKLGLPYKGFQKINDSQHINWAEDKQVDIIFAVGFSQLMKKDWLDMPKLGCVGFHPTKLPKGRGRAPLAWLVLEEKIGASTFFLMGEGADDGPIFVQKEFVVENKDNATCVEKKIQETIQKGLDEWLPKLKKGIWQPIPQNELDASWYGKRTPEDGYINWNNTADYINRLIKASSRPHPGAYTYIKDEKVVIQECREEFDIKIKGVVGRVLLTDDKKGYLIQCGQGLLWINNLSISSKLRIGEFLGYKIEDEIYKIKLKLKELEL